MEWISVEDRLPDSEADVLVFFNSNQVLTGYLDSRDFQQWRLPFSHEILHDVTHWMPLPEPPENDDE